jgi:hypothetical protein
VSQITITAPRDPTAVTLAPGQSFAATAYVVVDNSGATLPAGTLTGKETPPWTAVLAGTDGPHEASVTFTDLDSTGATIGAPVIFTESGQGGIPGQFFPTSKILGSITVTG